MFFGHYEHSIDEKGRITIPAKYREELDESFFVTLGYDGNLLGYPAEKFFQAGERIRKLSSFDSDARKLRRIHFANAEQVDFDKAGRVLLSSFLRDTANLTDKAVLVGSGDYFELWSPENWLAQKTDLSDIEANAKRFSALDYTTLP